LFGTQISNLTKENYAIASLARLNSLRYIDNSVAAYSFAPLGRRPARQGTFKTFPKPLKIFSIFLQHTHTA